MRLLIFIVLIFLSYLPLKAEPVFHESNDNIIEWADTHETRSRDEEDLIPPAVDINGSIMPYPDEDTSEENNEKEEEPVEGGAGNGYHGVE